MRCSPDQDEAHLFSGFLFCGDCQQSMTRKTVPSKTKKYIYYVCSTNKHNRTCSPHSISAKEVEEKVFRAIHDQIELVVNLEKALEMIERLPSQNRKAFNYEAQIAKLEEEIERYQKLKLRLYEDLSDGIIDKSEYFEFRNSYTKIIEEKQEALLRVKKEMKQSVTTGATERNWVTLFKQYENIEELNRRVLMALVDRILIYENHAIEIVFKYKGTTGGLEVVMRSIIYAAYSKDLSVKTTTAKIQMMKQGKYVGGYAPYGYVLHPEIRNKLKLDPEAAEVVRRVFDEALKGRNTSQIALGLNDDNIPTPGQYFKGKHPDKKKFSYMSDKISWTASMVYKLLTSYVYTGATVGHKRKSGGVGSRKTISQEKEDWIVVEGMHEAIVSKEEFELAQAVIRGGRKKPKRNPHHYPLKGLVCCGNCKRALTRRKLRNEGGYFYQCTHSTHDRGTECPVGERYSEAWIENTAYNAIGQMLALVEKKAVKEHEISKRRKSAISECADTIRDLQKQSEQLKGVKLRLYEKYTSASITKAEYLKRKAEVDAKITESEEAIRQGHERMQELDSEHPCSDERLDKVVGEFQKYEGLTYELAHALISVIYVHGQNDIEIVWKFKDIFEKAEIK